MVGGIVIGQWKGQPYLRSAPVRGKNSWTPDQVLHRQRFSKVNSFCKLFKASVIPQIWNAEAEMMSGYALFLKTNMPAFAADGSLDDQKKIRLSTGKLPLPEQFQAQRRVGEDSIIEVSWQKDAHLGGIHLQDELMIISAADGKYSEITGTGIIRNALGGSFELPASPMPPASGPMHIYLFFAAKNRRDYSDSVCFEV